MNSKRNTERTQMLRVDIQFLLHNWQATYYFVDMFDNLDISFQE